VLTALSCQSTQNPKETPHDSSSNQPVLSVEMGFGDLGEIVTEGDGQKVNSSPCLLASHVGLTHAAASHAGLGFGKGFFASHGAYVDVRHFSLWLNCYIGYGVL